MQTFLPIATIEYSRIAKTLDNKRLHKQALEGWQILMNLTELDPAGNHRTPGGWTNHPAVKMWRGSEQELVVYILAMVDEWVSRGYKSTLRQKVIATALIAKSEFRLGTAIPEWITDQDMFERIAVTHRQALLAKNYKHYSQFNWEEDTGKEPTEYTYLWPTEEYAIR
jgi:hypothetical protein